MKLTIYQIDAFADRVFTGNPAAVIVLEQWIEDALMQSIAEENNLAETAFVVRKGHLWQIRWFTPTVEVDLCGHATLATAWVLFEHYSESSPIRFHSERSGALEVLREGTLLTLDFPADDLVETRPPEALVKSMGLSPVASFKGKTDYMLVYQSQEEIESLQPDFRLLSKFDIRGVIATSKGRSVDFVSRWFGPNTGVDEDPVTGSAHTTLTPYWANSLQKQKMQAQQLSSRGGALICELKGDRVRISGKAVPYLKGEIEV